MRFSSWLLTFLILMLLGMAGRATYQYGLEQGRAEAAMVQAAAQAPVPQAAPPENLDEWMEVSVAPEESMKPTFAKSEAENPPQTLIFQTVPVR